MRLNCNFLLLAMFVALALGTAGCGGISASKTVSPLDFIMPGIMKANPPATNAPATFVENSTELAVAR